MEIAEGVKWIVGTLVAVFVAVGGFVGAAKLFEIRAMRKYAKQDKNEEIHATNQAKQIEFDAIAFQKISERLEKVESKLEDMQEKYTSQAIKNERLSAENEHLKQDMSRLQKRNEELQTENKQQALKIINLENSNKRLETEMQDLKSMINNRFGGKQPLT